MQKRAMVSSKKKLQSLKTGAEEEEQAVLRGKGAPSPKSSRGER